MLALLLLVLQDPAAAPAAAPAQARAASDPAALALLEQVAAAQHAAGKGRAVDGFDVQLNLQEKGEQPQEFDLGMRYSRRERETVELRMQDRAGGTEPVSKGFDGRRHWLRQGEGPIQDLGGHEFAQDRESIDEALEFAQDLLLVMDLHSFARIAEGLHLPAGAADERLLAGRFRRGEKAWEFTLVLPPAGAKEEPLPRELRLRQPNPDPAAAKETPFLDERRFVLRSYARENFRGRAVPQKILEFEPGAAEPLRILEIHGLIWADLPLAAGPK